MQSSRWQMSYTTVIPTDLVTPLGAYVRVRGAGEAAFLLESVERGRLGRYSFVGCGARVVGLEEAESADTPPSLHPRLAPRRLRSEDPRR